MSFSGRLASALLGLVALCVCDGCVQRTISINSDPPGALVILNDQEVGRTPVKRDFTWYGAYDMQLRKDGYETLDRKLSITAPVWLWPPADLAAELWPGRLKDERNFSFTLKSSTTQPVDPDAVFARAFELRGRLEQSQYTRQPATRISTTAPATQPTGEP